MVSGGDFPRKTPKSAAWRSNRIQVFGPGAHSGPKWRQGAPEYQENDSKTKHSGLPIFHFSRNSCKKPTESYMFFGTSGAHFREYRVTRRKPLIPIEQEGEDLIRFRDFFAPRKNNNKQLRLCRYFEVVFQEYRISRK